MHKRRGTKRLLAMTLSLLMCTSVFLCNIFTFAAEESNVPEDKIVQSLEATEQSEAQAEKQENAESGGVLQQEESPQIEEEKEADKTKEEMEPKVKIEKAAPADAVKKEVVKAQKRAEQSHVITSVEALLQDGSGPVGATIGQWQKFRIKAYYKLPDNTVKKGDTTTVQLPKELRFDQTLPFEIKDIEGHVIANAVVDGNNKQIVLTYTEYPEKHSGVGGDFFFYVRMDRRVVEGETDIPLDFIIGNNVISAGKVHFNGYPTPSGSVLSKSGTQEAKPNVNGNYAWFNVNVNTKGDDLKDVSVVDTLQSKGITIDKASIIIKKGEWKLEKGDFVLDKQKDVTNQFTIAWEPDATGFTLPLGDVGPNEGYQITYYVHSDYSLVDGERIDNNVVLHGKDIGAISYDANITWAVAGGSGVGYVYSIKIVKKDNAGNTLSGAVFVVIRDSTNQSVGTITTGDDGTGELEGLLRDKYKIVEVSPPAGYVLSQEEYFVEADAFNSDNVAELPPIINEPDKISIPVTKKWIGKPSDGAFIVLYADGYELTRTAVGTEDGWSHVFTDLPKFDKTDGRKIEYDVKEIGLEGKYKQEKEGDIEKGITFTNTITGKVNIPVTKEWVGPKANSVTVNLLAGDTKIDSIKLSAENNWTHTFKDLEKYKDGKEIRYTVEEKEIAGYKTEITGNAKDGYYIKNINTETRNVDVTKTWVGNPAKEITVRLFADGEEKDKVKITAKDGWKHSFKDLPVYNKDGTKIVYTISEDELDGYTSKISGDADKGFDVKNTKKSPPAVPKKNSPKTGDMTNVYRYIILMLASLLVIAAMYRSKKKE